MIRKAEFRLCFLFVILMVRITFTMLYKKSVKDKYLKPALLEILKKYNRLRITIPGLKLPRIPGLRPAPVAPVFWFNGLEPWLIDRLQKERMQG